MAITSIKFTTDGAEWLVDKMQETVSSTPSHIGIGTDGTAAAVGDSALGGEVDDREATSLSQPTATTLSAEATVTANTDYSPAGSGIEEAGLFTAVSSGILLARMVFTEVVMSTSDTITITFNLAPADAG